MFRFIRSRCLLIAILFAVSGHLSAQAPDQEEDIRGPKPLIEIPVTKKPPVALWCAIGGGILGLAGGAWLLRKHFKNRPGKTPSEIALATLGELENNGTALAAEKFANRAAQTVRLYIAERFGIAAPRRTTEEFLRDLAKDEKSSLFGESDHLRVFLKSCDLAKFAGSNLDSKQRAELVGAARRFINSTSNAATS